MMINLYQPLLFIVEVISNIEKALNSNDYSLQHVYKNVITCFLDTKEVQPLKIGLKY